ncbi:MAG: hypothetical protein NVS3B26_25800 [Mycobacteriales bacterium]
MRLRCKVFFQANAWLGVDGHRDGACDEWRGSLRRVLAPDQRDPEQDQDIPERLDQSRRLVEEQRPGRPAARGTARRRLAAC